jgi:hypothetical protein
MVSDVEGDDTACAALKQDVGEAAGRSADVERQLPGGGNRKGVERVRQLQAAAADVGMVGGGGRGRSRRRPPPVNRLSRRPARSLGLSRRG